MKKILGLICVSIVLFGCSGDSNVCLQSVQDKYPDSEISVIPGYSYSYIVRTSNGTVRYVKTGNLMDDAVSSDVMLFKGK